jgi:hypothetical protein
MARIARRNRGVAHGAKVLVPRGRAAATEVCASDRMAREAATMSAEVMPAAAEMRPATSVAPTVPAAMATTVTSAMATAASGDRGTRKHGQENNSGNSDHPPGHGTLPAVTPLTLRQKMTQQHGKSSTRSRRRAGRLRFTPPG